jgi:hypothetical protein
MKIKNEVRGTVTIFEAVMDARESDFLSSLHFFASESFTTKCT